MLFFCSLDLIVLCKVQIIMKIRTVIAENNKMLNKNLGFTNENNICIFNIKKFKEKHIFL